MSGADGKPKLTLKERMALKGKKVEDYTPTSDFIPAGVQPGGAGQAFGGSFQPAGFSPAFQPPQPAAPPKLDLGLGAVNQHTQLTDELYDIITKNYQVNPNKKSNQPLSQDRISPNYYFLLNEQHPYLYAQYFQRFQAEQARLQMAAYNQQFQGGYNGQHQQHDDDEDGEEEEPIQHKQGLKQVGVQGQQKPAGNDKKPQQAAQTPAQQKPAAAKQDTPAAKPQGNANAGNQKTGGKPGDKKDNQGAKDAGKGKASAPAPAPVKKYVEEIIDGCLSSTNAPSTLV